MPLNANEVVIGSFGNVFVAPVGTTGPTDATTALPAAWLELGYLSEDGIDFTPGQDIGETPAWQSAYPIRRTVNTRSLDLSFTLLQWNEVNLPFAMGGGAVTSAGTAPNITHTYTFPTAGTIDERAMVVQWNDGTKDYRLHVLRGMVTGLDGFTLTRTDAAGLGVTYSALGSTTAAIATIITDDPAFAV